MPNVIADFIGDNVNDIAGNCSDLLESFVATTAAGILIASTLFASGELSSSSYDAVMMYPVILAGGGEYFHDMAPAVSATAPVPVSS